MNEDIEDLVKLDPREAYPDCNDYTEDDWVEGDQLPIWDGKSIGGGTFERGE